MTEPTPTAPLYPVLEGPDSFRLGQVAQVRAQLEAENGAYSRTRRRYKLAYNVCAYTSSGLGAVSALSGSASVGTLASGIGAVAALPLGCVAIGAGAVSVVASLMQKIVLRKVKKHERISSIAAAKLGTVNAIVSQSLADETITHDEFVMVLRELEDYKTRKAEARQKSRREALDAQGKDLESLKKEMLEEGRKLGLQQVQDLLTRPSQQGTPSGSAYI